MKTIYIAWQDFETRLWHTVGQLTQKNGLYCFAYTKGALASPHFSYFGRMRNLYQTYYSHELFPLFANRILNSSRPEYPAYVSWLALNSEQKAEPMQLLSRSGGKRATDELCVYPHPELNLYGEMELFFLAHGLRYLEPASIASLANLQDGEHLLLQRESTNAFDPFALQLLNQEQTKVGYCPRYLNRDLQKILGKTDIHLTVERLNPDAPLQFRLLCKAVFIPPVDAELFAGDEYQLLHEHDMAAA